MSAELVGWTGAVMDHDVLLRAVDNTVKFLRMAAIELRRIAERAPDIADELSHLADQLDSDAGDLERAAGQQHP